MLISLHVKDYALIENIDVEFENGLNIITGETGAGKSILIGALSLLLGERASNQSVRKDAKKAVVEGVFDVRNNKKIASVLAENQIDFYDNLIIRREISAQGNNRNFLNDTPVSLSVIQEIGNHLVDLHGQHDHQLLLRAANHIDFVDSFHGNEQLLNSFNNHYNLIKELVEEINQLQEREKELKEKKDVYEFQLKEIEFVNPRLNEDDEIKSQLTILENSERLVSLCAELFDILYDKENSIYDEIGLVEKKLMELQKIDPAFEEKLSQMNGVASAINDIAEFARDYQNKIDVELTEVESLRERLAAINMIKKRYGGTIENVLTLKEKLIAELDLMENYDDKIAQLKIKLETARNEAGEIATELSNVRKSSAKKIQKEVEEKLAELGIQKAKFSVKILWQENSDSDNFVIIDDKQFKCFSNGVDSVEFFISTNIGEDLKPLSKVASGGEISRVMLALKSVLADNDKLPVLIFDEIDVGVSGRIAQKVGKALKTLAANHQVITITHLPQIAALSDKHYVVEKYTQGQRIVSLIRPLNTDEKIIEVAKLISGEALTEASINSAKELISEK
ncbi:MAG: DNA repair protein RecN [Ignavibacteriales bacterium]